MFVALLYIVRLLIIAIDLVIYEIVFQWVYYSYILGQTTVLLKFLSKLLLYVEHVLMWKSILLFLVSDSQNPQHASTETEAGVVTSESTPDA